MTDLKAAAQRALGVMQSLYYVLGRGGKRYGNLRREIETFRAALAEPERTLTDEVIAELWHKNGGFHHHFARSIERWLRGGA